MSETSHGRSVSLQQGTHTHTHFTSTHGHHPRVQSLQQQGTALARARERAHTCTQTDAYLVHLVGALRYESLYPRVVRPQSQVQQSLSQHTHCLSVSLRQPQQHRVPVRALPGGVGDDTELCEGAAEQGQGLGAHLFEGLGCGF